jgi:hypothetical protein
MDYDYEICVKCGEIYEDVDLKPFCSKCMDLKPFCSKCMIKEEKTLIA